MATLAGFGPLEPLHQHILATAWPLGSVRSVLEYFILPLIPIWFQAYVLVSPQQRETRPLRAALAVLGLALMWYGWSRWRVVELEYNAFNNGFTIVFLHLGLKSIEFALLRKHINDPYMRRGRSRVAAAFDLCFNSRLVSLGSVGLDTAAGAPNETLRDVSVERHLRHGKKHRHVAHVHSSHSSHRRRGGERERNGVQNGSANGAADARVHKVVHKHDTYLHSDLHRPKTRAGAIARHLLHMFVHYAVLDTLFALMRRTGPDTLAAVHAWVQPNLFATFLQRTSFVFLPGRLDWRIPTPIVQVATQGSIPLVIWQALSAAYHAGAALALATTLWEVQSWDVDLFDAPWKADSLIDLWGRRWHQLFRHQFIILSSATASLLRLPTTPFTLFPLTFIFSGALHALGELAMRPVPNPLKLASFFVLAGLGCAVEVAVKRVTGRRVRGALGRLWTWAFTFYTGRIATDAWLDAGIGGNRLLPDGGVGDYLAPWLLSWAFAPYERT